MANMYETVKRAIQDVIAPDLARIEGKIEALSAEIKRLDEKIDSKHNEMLVEIRRLDEKIESVRNELGTKIDIALDIRERLSTLEAKVALLTATNPPEKQQDK